MPLDSEFFLKPAMGGSAFIEDAPAAAEEALAGALLQSALATASSQEPVVTEVEVPATTARDVDSERLQNLLRKYGVKESHIRASVMRSRLTSESLTTIMRSSDYGFLSPERIAQVNAEMSNFPYFSPEDAEEVDSMSILAKVKDFKFEGFVPVQYLASGTLVVAVAETRDTNKAKSAFSQFNTEWRIASPRTIQSLYQWHFANTEEAFDVAYKRVKDIAEDADDAPKRLADLHMALIRHACYVGASDIAFHSMVKDTGGVVRLKVNGVGEIFRYIEATVYKRLINRFLTQNGNTDNLKKGPIEGQMTFGAEQQREYAEIYNRYSFRVEMIMRSEIVPMEFTSVVIRVLDQNAEVTDLDRLGFDPDDLKILRKAMRSAYGLILTTGPTGSGKTTTTYAMLSEIDPVENWIQSIERPIEYTKGLWMQYQVPMTKSEAEGTAELLKGILRNAPNVIYVAEVRDGPIGGQVIRAANTGHLAFSSLHNNDAGSALSRLRDLDLDMGDVAGVLLVILAQRLVRTLCHSCRVPDEREEAKEEIRRAEKYLGGKDVTLFRASDGCLSCKFTGYRSRRMVYELLHVTPKARRLITEGTAPYLVAQEFIAPERTLRSRAVRLMAAGITSYEEVERLEERE